MGKVLHCLILFHLAEAHTSSCQPCVASSQMCVCVCTHRRAALNHEGERHIRPAWRFVWSDIIRWKATLGHLV